MNPLRNGDLTPIHPDAAELIDSAQGCARMMAECCAAKDAEIARLREAIREAVESRHAESCKRDTILRWLAAWQTLEKIAREER